MRKIVAIIGDAAIEENGDKFLVAFETGKALIDNGFRIQCGGLKGVMEAACKGARASEKYKDGDIIAIVPSFDPTRANEYADIVIPTGLDIYRNVIVAAASAVVMIGGGSGTLTEVANAWSLKRLIVAIKGVDGWSGKLADNRIDGRVRYENIADDRVFGATSGKEAVDIIKEKIDLYNEYHKGIGV